MSLWEPRRFGSLQGPIKRRNSSGAPTNLSLVPPSRPYSPKCVEWGFCELRLTGVLGSGAKTDAPNYGGWHHDCGYRAD
jgi:hypothetical protein